MMVLQKLQNVVMLERMERLYKQLVPFGICCSIIQTGEKPKQVKGLDARAIPVV